MYTCKRVRAMWLLRIIVIVLYTRIGTVIILYGELSGERAPNFCRTPGRPGLIRTVYYELRAKYDRRIILNVYIRRT